MRAIAIREELTDQWQKHGVELAKEYKILTAEISKATFGVTPSEYKKIKGLKRENLRDHMNDLELFFPSLVKQQQQKSPNQNILMGLKGINKSPDVEAKLPEMPDLILKRKQEER